MGKKKTKEPRYHVEVITKARVDNIGLNWEYLVKWAAYSPRHDSWLPADNLKDCDPLLKKFWRHVGVDDGDYPANYEVAALEDWIKEEQTSFRNNYPEEMAEAQRQREREERKERAKQEREQERRQHSEKRKQEKMLASVQPRAVGGPSKGGRIIMSSSSENNSDSPPDDAPPVSNIPAKRKGPSLQPITIPPRKSLKLDDIVPGTSIQSANLSLQKEARPADGRKVRDSSPDSPNSLFSDHPSPDVAIPATTSTAVAGSSSKTNVAVKVGSRTKPKQRLVKLIEPENLKDSSLLSTKQKLIQRAFTTAAPKPPETNKMSKKSIPEHISSSSKQFEATTQSEPQPVLVQDDPMDAIMTMPIVDNVAESVALCPSPAEYLPLVDYDPDPFASFETPAEPQTSPVVRAPDLPVVAAQDADSFLNQMMITDLIVEPAVTFQTVHAEVVDSLSIKPKWKWTGDLFTGPLKNVKNERLCEILLTDATDHLPEGLRLNILLSETVAIRFERLCDATSIDIVLGPHKRSEQVARMAPCNEEDTAILKSLGRWMATNQQVSLMSMFANDYEVAVLLTFPPSMTGLCKRFRVPEELQNAILVSTVIPLSIDPIQKELEWKGRSAASTKASFPFYEIVKTENRKEFLRFNPTYCQGIRMLKFPRSLYDFLLSSARTYCIWPPSGERSSLETNSLIKILNCHGAKDVGLKGDVRIVFLHVGGMKTLPHLPGLAEKRSKQPQIRFYMYGTHEAVTPSRWHMHEVFPIGGVVTFTPQAILDNPLGASELINQISEHSLWCAFLLPSVLGMVAKIICGQEDPLKMFDRGVLGLEMLLHQIENCSLALIGSPPIARSPLRDSDPISQWIRTQWKVMSMQTRGLLEYGVQAWRESYSALREPEWPAAVRTEITDEMTRMQMQPAIMDSYRRFVVIRAPSEAGLGEYHLGYEWVTASMFDFKDRFYSTDERGHAR